MDEARAKEYAFLLYATVAAVAYGVAHDHVTATISPEYFLRGKGLAMDPQPFRCAVTELAVRASCGTGLLAGAALLVANDPRARGRPPQLTYRALVALSFIPLVVAALFAVVGGLVNAGARVGSATAGALGVAPDRVRPFAIVWAIHAGSYAGALLGTVASVLAVLARRRKWARARKSLAERAGFESAQPVRVEAASSEDREVGRQGASRTPR
jgi:hypothetical protein